MSYKKIIRDDGSVVMEPEEPPPIICLDLTFSEVQQLTHALFLKYIKATNRELSEFSHLCYNDGEYEAYKFEKWALETNPPELPTIQAFDAVEENMDEYGAWYSGAVMDVCNGLVKNEN